ncbi:DUF6313 family protein [Paractinoplanes deccanensis]|uniref:DUF6313 family protein n=1 Tax=Paractinoplanes deccanensis TaxID=113561 RepID=UPI0019456DCE|nr:DUF6313 family protein [Actinoplanes deccanensis]
MIPRLDHLCNSFNVSADFVDRFVKQHGEEHWDLAEKHWEDIVARVLNTDAVDVNASRSRAVHQAVTAAVRLLEDERLRDRCPLCPGDRRPPSRRAWLHWWRR